MGSITTYQELRNALAISSDTLTVATDFSATLTQLTTDCYGGQPIVITQAQPGPGDGLNEQVVVAGTATFLNASLPVIATFWLDSSSQVQALLRYTLLGAAPGPGAWQFSTSFPDLPTTNGLMTSPTAEPVALLDELALTDSAFVVTTSAGPDALTAVPLAYGLNFVGQTQPAGLFGVLLNAFDSGTSFCLYGPITLPKPAETITPLAPLQYPWDLPAPVPGIWLQASLGVAITLGKVEFDKTVFQVYSPVSTAWLLTNPTFEPTVAFGGELAIPSADITVALTGSMSPGDSLLLLRGEFTGVSVSKLASLADVAGAGDLSGALPTQLQDAVGTLGELELQTAALLLTAGTTGLSVLGTYFTLGFPNLTWPLNIGSFEVDSLAANFAIQSPFSAPQVGVTVTGQLLIEGVAFDVAAASQDEFTIYVALESSVSLPLNSFLTSHFSSVPAPADLSIDQLQLAVAPGKWYAFGLAMAAAPATWTLPLGPVALQVSDVVMNLQYPAGGPVAGSVGGTLTIGTIATFAVQYTIPGDVTLRATLPDVSLTQLVSELLQLSLPVPAAFDLDFEDSSVLLQKQQDDYTFQLATELAGFGLLALQAQKNAGAWGVAAGLDMASGPASSLPGLSFLAKFEQLFALDKLLLVVSTFADPAFNFPDTAAFDNPSLGTKNITLPATSGGALVAGLNFYGEWTLDTTNSGQRLLNKFLGTSPVLAITLQVSKVPEQNSRLFVSFATTVQGHPLQAEFGGMVVNGSPALFLTGTMTVSIQDQPQTFDVTMLFVANGAFLSADMKGTSAVKFGVFQLADLALEIGIDLDGIPSLGVAATIDFETIDSSVAVFFDSADPSKSLVAGSVSNLHLGDVFNAFTDNLAKSPLDAVLNTVAVKGTNSFEVSDAGSALANDLDNLQLAAFAAQCLAVGQLTLPTGAGQFLLIVNTTGALWYYTDLVKMRHYAFTKAGSAITVTTEAQFYCAPQATTIASIQFPQGFYLNGAIEFLGLTASMTLEVDPQQGISLDATMDKLVIGDKALFSLTDTTGASGPTISLSTYANPAEPVPEFQAPHFYINGQLEMLGTTKTVFVSITESEALFDIEGDLVPTLVNGELNGSFSSLTNMSVGGTLNVGIQDVDLGALGSFSLKTGAQGAVDFQVSGTAVAADLDVSFELGGDTIQVGKVAISIGNQGFADLPAMLFDSIKTTLQNLFKDPQVWAKYAASALGWVQDQIEGVLESVFPGLSASDIATILAVVFPVCALTQALGSM